jgi:PAS domain S-box-containing protein
MNEFIPEALSSPKTTSVRALELFQATQQSLFRHTDRLFAWLLLCEWLAGIAAATFISPVTWTGTQSHLHLHVMAAFILGGVVAALPIFFAITRPGTVMTRHVVAIGQMLMSALLIHVTGGRIETHFHVFGSLAILAFYRDWQVLVSASLVVVMDHLWRGIFWPQSVYGVTTAPIWRTLEHGWWVIFEVTFLVVSIRKSLGETMNIAERQAELEVVNVTIERKVTERTAALTREITERRLAEENLQQSEAQLAKAQRIAHLGSWEWNFQKNKVSWSDETARLYGFTPEDLGSEMDRCLERVHPEDREKVKTALAESARTGDPFACDHRALLPDGTIRFMHGIGEVILDEQEKPVKIIGIMQDVTKAKAAEDALRHSEEQLRQSQKMEAVGQLAGGVAHDFNNLLTVISGYSSMSLQKMELNSALRRNTEEILKAAERAAGLTSQLLAFSRKQVLQPKVLNLNQAIGGMGKMLRRLIGEDIELFTVLDAGLGNVKADPGQIEQVILNLAVNARDAMPRGGKLTIRTANVSLDLKTSFRNRDLNVGEYVMLAVSDTGVGMTEEVKSHLFEPFFTTKGLGRGTGLGLATCYGIICQSNGDIRVYSELNNGTTFKIYLPRVNAPVSAIRPDAGALAPGNEQILIVEDDEAVRRLSASVLRGCGYKVHEAHDAVEALEQMDALELDLVLTDVIMPKMSGKELADHIKRAHPALKILFMSGYTDDALAHHGVLEPGISFLEKPFSPARLTRKVRQVLDGSVGPQPTGNPNENSLVNAFEPAS